MRELVLFIARQDPEGQPGAIRSQPGLRQLGRIGNEQRVMPKPPLPTRLSEQKMAPASSLGKQAAPAGACAATGGWRHSTHRKKAPGQRPEPGASADSSTCRLRASCD